MRKGGRIECLSALTAKKTKRIVGLVSSAMNGHGMFLAKKKRRVCSDNQSSLGFANLF